MKETAAQILIRTSQRWYKIRHLDSDTRKYLMSLSENEFKIELQNLAKPVA